MITITTRSNKGSFSLLTAVIAGFLLLPATLFTFEICRITLAQKELNAATDAAALSAAIAISKNSDKDTADLAKLGHNQGLMYLRRNSVYGRSFADTSFGSAQNTNLPLHQGSFNLDYDPINSIVTARSEFGMDLAFGNLLNLGPTTIRSVSKSTTTSASSIHPVRIPP